MPIVTGNEAVDGFLEVYGASPAKYMAKVVDYAAAMQISDAQKISALQNVFAKWAEANGHPLRMFLSLGTLKAEELPDAVKADYSALQINVLKAAYELLADSETKVSGALTTIQDRRAAIGDLIN